MNLYILILMLAFNFTAFGQTLTGVTISGQKWKVTREAPRADLAIPAGEAGGQQKDWLLHAEINKQRAAQGLPPEPPPRSISTIRQPVSKKNIYVYEAKIKNSGNKTVKAITWEYIFYDTSKQRELGRLRFTSNKIVGPGQEKKLIVQTEIPPTKVIVAATDDSKVKGQYSEAVVIKSIEYTDGSVD